MIKESCQFETRHVLYCDILGFSPYVLGEFFEPARCFRIFHQLDQWIEEASKEIAASLPDAITGQVPEHIVKPEIIYCSDSIVISTTATNIDAIWLCVAAAKLQELICAHGFLLRGAIVTGQLYHSGNTLFGPAIAKAVSIERTDHRPVISVSPETLGIFSYAMSSEDKEIIRIRAQQLIVHENNSLPYIDHFWLSKIAANQKNLHPGQRANIESWRALINTGLKNKDPKVVQKYAWVAKRFNQSLCNKISAIKPITTENKPTA